MGIFEDSSLVDSQVLGSSRLVSLSFEPPDIRNWFSSYEYESPALDSIDNFGDSMSKDREIMEDESSADEKSGENGENSGEFRDMKNVNEGEAAQKFPSTWIPLKCTELEDSPEIQPLDMNQDSWSSHPPLSEPPDVRNWFSSYEYESPPLHSSQEFGGYNNSENTGFIAEERNDEIEEALESDRKIRKGNEGIVGEKVYLKAFVKCNGSKEEQQPLNEVSGMLWKNHLSSEQNLFSERTWGKTPKEISLETKGIKRTKDVPVSSLTTEDSQCKLQNKGAQENGPLQLHIDRNSINDNKKYVIPTTLIDPGLNLKAIFRPRHFHDAPNYQRTESLQTEVQTEHDCPSDGNNVQSELTNLGNNKENSDGLVSAGKHELSGAIYKKPVERPENYNKEAGFAAALPRRKVFSDKTNVEHSDMMEVIGKWSCPQKRKPDLGPPLKQLRLERWVRKVRED